MTYILKNCPHCNSEMEDDGDTLYRSGSWEDTKDGRVYGSSRMYANDRYQVWCNVGYGGCGVTVYGDTIEEAVSKWNTQYNNECGFCEEPVINTEPDKKYSGVIGEHGFVDLVKKDTPGSFTLYNKMCKCGVELCSLVTDTETRNMPQNRKV